MSEQALFQNISEFISESPEWVDKWFNLPVKAKYSQNALLIPEILAHVLNFLPLNKYRKVSRLWYREVQIAEKVRAEYLEKLPLVDFHQFYRNNRAWKKQIREELYRRRELAVEKYWNVVPKYKKVVNEHFRIKFGTPEYKISSERFDKLGDKKRELFTDQVAVEQIILNNNLCASNYEIHQFYKNFEMLELGYDPDDVDISEEFTNDYWDDEDPDEDEPDTPDESDEEESD